jgi:4-amino-4-deoxy-L-arabinose transferase-like glycosyltransferase
LDYLTNDGNQIRNSSFALLAFLVGCILLIPILFYPFGQDHATYYRGGLSVLNGGLIYVDFIDVKPPLIYYISAVAIKLFGTNEASLRIAEYLWQSATIAVLVHVVYKRTANKAAALMSSILYATR